MQEQCTVKFRRKSKFAKMDEKLYRKKDIFFVVRKAKEKGFIKKSSQLKNKNIYHFFYIIKDKEDILKLHITLEKDDPYLSLFKELQEGKFPFWKKICATFLLTTGLSLIYPITMSEDTSDTIHIAEENFDNFLDDLFQTYDEKNALSFHKTLVEGFQKEIDEETEPILESFRYEDTLKEAVEGVCAIKNYDHTDIITTYYDCTNRVLEKEKLASIIYKNSKKGYDEYESIHYDEVYIIMQEVEKYIAYMLEMDSDFDLGHFLCNLKDLQIYKNKFYSPDQKGIIAFMPVVSSREKILIFNLFTEEKINDPYKWCGDSETIHHEMEHLYEMGCTCSKNKIYECGSSFIFSDQANWVSRYYYERYYIRFLSEWSAEEAEDFGVPHFSYFTEDRIFQNLEFALSINPDYEKGTLANTIRNREILKMWKQFPYFYNEEEELKEYLQMLKCYDMALYENVDTSYANYACSKHIELFYKNLLYANEVSDENLIFYNFSMITSFEEQIKIQASVLLEDIEQIEDYLKECRKQFKKYLTQKYNLKEIESVENNISSFEGYEISSQIKYPQYVSMEKQLFFSSMLLEIETPYMESETELSYTYK